MFALPRGHRYARRKSLSFAEMNGENMLLMPDIGFWNFVCRDKMPDFPLPGAERPLQIRIRLESGIKEASHKAAHSYKMHTTIGLNLTGVLILVAGNG